MPYASDPAGHVCVCVRDRASTHAYFVSERESSVHACGCLIKVVCLNQDIILYI